MRPTNPNGQSTFRIRQHKVALGGTLRIVKTLRATCASCGKDGASFATNCDYGNAMRLLAQHRTNAAKRALGQWYCGKCWPETPAGKKSATPTSRKQQTTHLNDLI